MTDRAAYTAYSFYRWRYWNSSTGQEYYTYGSGMDGTYEEIQVAGGTYTYYKSYDGNAAYTVNGQTGLWFGCNAVTVPAVTHIEYRYRDRSKIYTYYHTKTEAMESDTAVAESDVIGNVQKWVKYTAK